MEEYFATLEKYNFWNGNVPELGFPCKEYTDKIVDYTGNKLVKVLVGQCRAGKSYILRQIANRLIESGVNPLNIFYIKFDFLTDYKDLESLLKQYKDRLKPEGKVWLFIDEIQNILGWEHFVNSHSQDFVESYSYQ